MIQRAGVQTLVVDRADSVAASWHRHYDRLHLHTVRWLSHLPGYRIPRRYGRWVHRDDVVKYLEEYARHHRIEVLTETEVRRIERAGAAWSLDTSGGEIVADYVVIATGYNHTPFMPEFPGRDSFEGEL